MEHNQKMNAREAGKLLSKLGSAKGGRVRAERLSPERRSEIARKAAQARWKNQKVRFNDVIK